MLYLVAGSKQSSAPISSKKAIEERRRTAAENKLHKEEQEKMNMAGRADHVYPYNRLISMHIREKDKVPVVLMEWTETLAYETLDTLSLDVPKRDIERLAKKSGINLKKLKHHK